MSDRDLDGAYAVVGIITFIAKAILFVVIVRAAWLAGNYFARACP